MVDSDEATVVGDRAAVTCQSAFKFGVEAEDGDGSNIPKRSNSGDIVRLDVRADAIGADNLGPRLIVAVAIGRPGVLGEELEFV